MDILANKYRPKKLADIIGQESAVKILSNTITSGQLHHAYIFGGKFGIGKTSCSRIFAASVNNKSGMTLEPDLSDPDILDIYEGKSKDVREIDAASNRGIEDIRELKNVIQYSPFVFKYRFVIIDEAHRLTGDGAEAALKMIEEPPKNVIFILCTTDVDKLKETIHSRCISLRFNKVPVETIFHNLKKIATSEKIEIEDSAVRLAARLSKNSVRNSIQNLQTLITFANGQKITSEIAENALSAVNENKYFDLVDAILKPDAGEAMRIIESILCGGRDVGEVVNGLVDHLRTMLIIQTCQSTAKLLFLTEEEKKKFTHQSKDLSIPIILYMLDAISEVNKGIALNLNPQTMLEKFVVQSIIFGKTDRNNKS